MKRIFRTLTVLMLTCVGTGCAFIKPTTEVTFNAATGSFRLYNTKDVTVSMGDIKVSKNPDGTFTFDLTASETPAFTLNDAASPVITANVQQMLAFVEQQKAATANIEAVMNGLTGIVGQLIPLFGGGTVSPAASQGVLSNLQGMMTNLQAAKTQIDAATKTASCAAGTCGK